MANPIEEVLGTAASIAKGMGVTLREMLSPTVTENYPDEPPKFEERFRGVHVLQRDENGMEKCVACFLCAAACPSNCIYIEAAENTELVRISGGERYAKVSSPESIRFPAGRSRATSFSADAPSAASPTTSNPAASSKRTRERPKRRVIIHDQDRTAHALIVAWARGIASGLPPTLIPPRPHTKDISSNRFACR